MAQQNKSSNTFNDKNMENKQVTKVATETRLAVGITVGMIAAFFVGLAFVGVLGSLMTKTEQPAPIVQPLPVVEEGPNFRMVVVENFDLTALVVNSDKPESDIAAFKEEIENRGDRIFLILSKRKNQELNSLESEHLFIGRIAEDNYEVIRENALVTELITSNDILAKDSLDEYSAVTQEFLNSYKKIVYSEVVVSDRKEVLDLGKDTITDEEALEMIIEDVNNDSSLTKEERQGEIQIHQDYYESQMDGGEKSSTPGASGMHGLIYVDLIYVESAASGSGDENWTYDQYIDHSLNTLYGLYGLADAAPESKNLSFHVLYENPADSDQQTEYEPSTNVENKYWVHQLMRNRNVCVFGTTDFDICFDTVNSFQSEVDKYSQEMADYFNAQTAFVIFVVKDELRPAVNGDNYWPQAYLGHFAILNWSYGMNNLDEPTGLAIDQINNKLYTVDKFNNRVARFDSGSGGTTFGQNQESMTLGLGLSSPWGVSVDSGNNKVYVADTSNNRVVRFDSGSGGTTLGFNIEQFGTVGSGVGQFNGPKGIAIDDINNKVYVVDTSNNRVARFDSGSGGTVFGDNWETFGSYGWGGTNRFWNPLGIAIDSVGNKVYVADEMNGRVVLFDSGSGGTVFGDNWNTIGISIPQDIAIDTVHDKVYVSGFNMFYDYRFDSGTGGTTFGDNIESADALYSGSIVVDSLSNSYYRLVGSAIYRLDSGSGGTVFGDNEIGIFLEGARDLRRDSSVAAHESAHVFFAEDEYGRTDSIGCNARATAANRVIAAGGNSAKTNENDIICSPYQIDSLMKNGAWSDCGHFCDDLGEPMFDWHTMAQIGWGDTDILEININNPEGLDGRVYVYIDDQPQAQAQRDIKSSEGTSSVRISITEGVHKLEVFGYPYYEHEVFLTIVGEQYINVTIPAIAGPGPNYGITTIDVDVGDGCDDGTDPYSCNASRQYCDGRYLANDCIKCGCESDYICNTAINECVTCIENRTCADDDPCTVDTCVDTGTADAYCESTPAVSSCGDRTCGFDSWAHCFACGDNEGLCVEAGDVCTDEGYCEQVCEGGVLPGECNIPGDTGKICIDGELTETDCMDCDCRSGYQCDTVSRTCECNVDCSRPENDDHSCCPTPVYR
ncbi:MAG: NHL repeat-containing protein [Candidatus Kerfeldbacteria bacterium]